MDLDDQWLVSQYECFEKEIADLWQLSQDEFRDQVTEIAKNYLRPEISNELYNHAIEKCQQSIESAVSTDQPNSHAHFQLGYYYQFGHGNLTVDLNKAKYHYEKAIQHNHYAAMYQICSVYDQLTPEVNGNHDVNNSLITQPTIEKIDPHKLISIKIEMYIKAAANGLHEKAIRDLRFHYLQHHEWTSAIDHLKAQFEEQIETAVAKDTNIGEIYNNLGFLECFLEWCQIVEGDEGDEPVVDFPQQAYDYFLKAGELGIPSGYMNYAFYRGYDINCVDHETDGIKNNFMIMAKYYLKAAQNGCAISWQKLYDVLKVEFKSSTSKRNLLRYAQNGLKHYRFSDILFSVANTIMTQNDIQVASFSQVIHYLEEAVVACHSYATDSLRNEFLYLGFMYEEGLGVQRDNTKAAHFYAWSIATQCECTLAVCRLAKLIEKRQLDPYDITHAVKLYESTMLLIKQDVTSYAQYRLGNMFRSGRYEAIGMQSDMAEYHYDGTSNAMISLMLSGKATVAHIYHLAKMHAIGCMVDPVVEKAIGLYRDTLAYYQDSDYLDRFYAMKAKLQLEDIKSCDRLDYKEEMCLLQDELSLIKLPSPSKLLMNTVDIVYKYQSLNVELSYRQPIYDKLIHELNSQPKASTYYHLGNLYFRGKTFQHFEPALAMEYLSKAHEMNYPLAKFDALYLYGCKEKGDDDSLFYEIIESAEESAEVELLMILDAAYQCDRRALPFIRKRLELFHAWKVAVDNIIKRHKNDLMSEDKMKSLSPANLARLYLELGFLIMVQNFDKDHISENVISEIKTHFEKADSYDSKNVDFFMGQLYELIDSSERTYKNISQRAIACYERILHVNNPHLSSVIAKYYVNERSDDNHHNHNIFDQLQQSHQLGFADATGQLSMIYLDGRCGITQNFEKFIQLAEATLATTYNNDVDNTYLYHHLAFTYYHYSHVSDRFKRAAHFCALDINQQVNDGRTRCLLAKILEKRCLSSNCIVDAIKIYVSALYLNNDLSGYIHYRLGKLRSNLKEIEIYNLSLAKQHFLRAYHYMASAKTTNLVNKCRDMYHLGCMFQYGYGIDRCLTTAKEWYQKCLACKQNCTNTFGCHLITYYAGKAGKQLDAIEQNTPDRR